MKRIILRCFHNKLCRIHLTHFEYMTLDLLFIEIHTSHRGKDSKRMIYKLGENYSETQARTYRRF